MDLRNKIQCTKQSKPGFSNKNKVGVGKQRFLWGGLLWEWVEKGHGHNINITLA